MRMTGFALLLTGLGLAVLQLVLSKGAPLPSDSFTGTAVIYNLAAVMGIGGLVTMLFGRAGTPVDEPESQYLRLVG